MKHVKIMIEFDCEDDTDVSSYVNALSTLYDCGGEEQNVSIYEVEE